MNYPPLMLNFRTKSARTFNTCPRCQSKNFLKVEDEVFCSSCDWSTIEANVEAKIQAHLRRHKTTQSLNSTQNLATQN